MVLVSHTAEFIFLKTRKTAGTSVEMMLQSACMPPGHEVIETTNAIVCKEGIVGCRMVGINRSGNSDPINRKWKNHRSARRVLFSLGPYKFFKYRKISAVRDPFSRCVSLFYWYGELGHFAIDENPNSFRSLFRRFICNANWPDDRKIVSILGKHIVDDYVRFESLRADLEKLSERLSLPIDLDRLPHTKKSPRHKTKLSIEEMYDSRSVDVVRRRMKWVFDRFDYPETPRSRNGGPA